MSENKLNKIISLLQNEVRAEGTSFSIYQNSVIIYYAPSKKTALHWGLLDKLNKIIDVIGIVNYKRKIKHYCKNDNYREYVHTEIKKGYRIFLRNK